MASYMFSLLAIALPSALSPVQPGSHFTFLTMIFLVTFLLPLLCMGIFRTFGTIDSLLMRTRRERFIPFLFITGIYVSVTWMFISNGRLSFDDNFVRLLMVIDLLVLMSTVVTFFFKVSVHSIGIWGLVGIMVPLSRLAEINAMLYISAGLILMAGPVMASRLYLGAHDYREVMWGAILGLAASVSGMLILF